MSPIETRLIGSLKHMHEAPPPRPRPLTPTRPRPLTPNTPPPPS